MTGALRRACADVDAPLGLVLEGGYSIEALASSMAALMPVLGDADPPPDDDAPDDLPPAVAARRRLSPWWPALSPA
jgi:acetoin utilization deacetylase AcuC-like enzyme